MNSQTKIMSNVVVTVTNPTKNIIKRYYGSNTVTSKLLFGIANYLSTAYNEADSGLFGRYLPSYIRLGTSTVPSHVTDTDLKEPVVGEGEDDNKYRADIYNIRSGIIDGVQDSMQVIYRAQFDAYAYKSDLELHEAGLFGPFMYNSSSDSYSSELLARVILTDEEGNGIKQPDDAIIDVQWTIKISAVINNN